MEGIIKDIPELAPILKIEPQPAIGIERMQQTIFGPSPFKPKGNVLEGYVEGKRSYIEVPKNLYDAMTGLNVPVLTKNFMYRAVRLFGGTVFGGSLQ